MEKLVIAASSKFQNEINNWKEYFIKQGYNVINYPKKLNEDQMDKYQEIYIRFFESLNEADILFVLNEEKNGIKGYIGAETFAELSYVITQKIINNQDKQIWLLNKPSEEVKCYMEIMNFIKWGWIEILNKN